uniref:AIG1-type G domain-containing protein n=1 Tax=Auxenochlorella protothecoides TaxID=3075 RepID=A0A1D2A0U4_AUXPR
MSHTPISSDEEVYLSDPPSDLDTDAKTEDDYEYHPANQDSFVNSPAVSVKVTPRGGFGEGVSVLIEGGGVTAPSTNGHSPRSVHSAPPHDHERESGASSSCPIDVAAILERATRSESGVEGSAGDKHLPQVPRPSLQPRTPVRTRAEPIAPPPADSEAGEPQSAPRGLPSLPGRPLPKQAPKGLPSALPARPSGTVPARPAGLGLGLPAQHRPAPREESTPGFQVAPPPRAQPDQASESESEYEEQSGSEEEGIKEETRPAPAPRSAGGPFLPPRPGKGAASSPVPAAGPPVGLGVRPGAASNGNGPSLPPRPSGTGTEAGSAPRPDQPGSAFAAEMAARVEAARAAEAAAAAAEAADPALRALRAKVQAFRVTTHRVATRLGVSPRASVLQQALYRLNMAERLQLSQRTGALGGGGGPGAPPGGGAADEAALREAEEAEAAGEPLDFGAVVLVIGLRGTGKSATIDSLLGRSGDGGAGAGGAAASGGGYVPTRRVSLERGEVAGLRLTFIDTPGLEASAGAASRNAATLRAIRRAFDAHKPHAVLYVDRLDASRRDASELHALHAVSDTLGADAWFSTLLCVTHALAPPPDGASGQPLGQDAYLQNRQQQLVQVMRAVAGDSRMMNPVALVENSPACARGAGGEPVLPNGVAWRRHLLMLCATTRVLNEASTLLKPGRGAKSPPGGARAPPGFGGGSMKVPPMAWLLAKLVEFRAPRKFPEDERELMRDDEIAGLPPAQREFQLRRRRVYLRQRADEARGEENAVPILAPEPALGPSFDPEVNNHRYRVLESPKALLTRPVIGEGGVDHEDGIDSVQVEKSAILRKRTQFLGGVPTLSWVQVQKDKNSLTFQGESDAALYHSTYWVSYASVNAQSLQRDVLYTGRLESRVRSKGKRQKFTVGLLASKLGEDFTLPPIKGGNGAYGLKLDERLRITDSIKLRAAVGRLLTKMGTHYEPGTAVAADLKLRNPADDSARLLLGGSAQWQGRDKRAAKQSLVMGGNIAGEVRLPKMDGTGMKSDTQVSANAQYTTRGQGTLALRINSHDVPQLAAIMLVPVLRAAWDKCFAREVEAF